MESNEKYVDNIKPSTLETIDYALFEWVDKTISANCKTNDGFKKVPVIWTSAERTFQIKNYKDLRDADGTLVTPYISVERGSINKAPNSSKGAFAANIKGFDRISYTTIINQEKTSKYANNSAFNKNKKINYALTRTPQVVYQTKSIRVPTYINVDYTISIKTSYLQQINEILGPFLTFTRATKHFIIKYDGFSYEAFIGEAYDVEEGSSNLETEERQYVSKLTIKVTGYLIGAGSNEDDQRVITQENRVSIKLPKENIILQERQIAPRKRQTTSEGQQIGDTVSALKKVYLIGDGINSVYSVLHGLNTRDMYFSIRENFGDFAKVEVAVSYLDLNTISIDMGDIIGVDSYAVTIIG